MKRNYTLSLTEENMAVLRTHSHNLSGLVDGLILTYLNTVREPEPREETDFDRNKRASEAAYEAQHKADVEAKTRELTIEYGRAMDDGRKEDAAEIRRKIRELHGIELTSKGPEVIL